MSSPETIESDIAQQERTLEALQAEARAGRALFSSGRLRVMGEALEDKKRHLAEFKQRPGETPKLPLELYDERVRDILAEIVSLQEVFEFTLKKGLTKKKLQMLHDGLDAAQDRLQELDGQTEGAARSKERRALVGLMNKMRTDYPANMQHGRLLVVRDLHRRVRAAYSSVQHTLTVDQRREMRTRIASLSSLVRRAEDERLAGVSAAVFAAVSYATEHAPAIAHAAAAHIPKQIPVSIKRGPLAMFVAAFRLK